ncbi:MAG: hypothetical protein KF859_07150 [Phycisphaeraceae bacterium]|nr:hypothetical protein [Phycisphaeraceae bacterium]
MNEAEHDILISRVVDGAASREDWAALERAGAKEPALWRDVALSLRDHARLSQAVAGATACAERVHTTDVRHGHESIPFSHAVVMSRTRRAAAWGGWAAAAAIALAMVGRGTLPAGGDGDGPIVAGLSQFTPGQLWSAYVQNGVAEGSVIAEVPDREVVEVEQLPDGGGLIVIYKRAVIERARVENPQLMRMSVDELGRPVPVPVPPVAPTRHESVRTPSKPTI